MSVDSDSRLYVANYQSGGTGYLVTYKPDSGKVLRTLSSGINYPEVTRADATGIVYVANDITNNHVAVVTGHGARLQRTINGTANVTAFAFDQRDNVYIANPPVNAVMVYSRAGKNLLHTITQRVEYPLDAVIGPDGDLYVANCGKSCTGHHSGSNGTITVYALPGGKLVRTISLGVAYPRAIAFDNLGNLYVANKGPHPPGSVTEYPPNATAPSASITDGVDNPSALAIDNSGTLYVANTATNEVIIYPALQSRPSATINVNLNEYPHQVQVAP
jgi:sugar lactone lactonase YvrE